MNWRRWLLVLAILSISLYVRWFDLACAPMPHATDDEFHYLWVGLSLLSEGRAVSWSDLSAFPQQGAVLGHVITDGHRYNMVTPALDHPPLFSIVAGAFAWCIGAATPVRIPFLEGGELSMWKVDLERCRYLTLILFSAAFLLLFDLARRSFSFGTACLTLVFFGLTAHVVFHQRLLVTESLSVPLFLLNLVILDRYLKGEVSQRVFSGVTVGTIAASLMCKLIAVSQAGAIALLLLQADRRKELIHPILGVVTGLALYLSYAWWQGWEVFIAVMNSQSGRFNGFNALEKIIITPRLVHDFDFSYLVFLGWISLFILTAARRGKGVLAAPLVYLLGFVFFTSAAAIFGWHLLPFYPFLCLGLAACVRDVYKRGEVFSYLLLAFFLVPYGAQILYLSNEASVTRIRILYLLVVAALLVASSLHIRQRLQIMRYSVTVLLILSLYGEVVRIWIPPLG